MEDVAAGCFMTVWWSGVKRNKVKSRENNQLLMSWIKDNCQHSHALLLFLFSQHFDAANS
jgi:hypothetical protein